MSPVNAEVTTTVRDLVRAYKKEFDRHMRRHPDREDICVYVVARKFCVSQQSVRRYLFLLELPKDIQRLVYDGEIGITQLRQLMHVEGWVRHMLCAWMTAPIRGGMRRYQCMTQNDLRIASNQIKMLHA